MAKSELSITVNAENIPEVRAYIAMLIEAGDALAEFVVGLPFDQQPNGLVNAWMFLKDEPVVDHNSDTPRPQA